MNWPWRRRSTSPVVSIPPTDSEEATRARCRSEAELEMVKEQAEKVTSVADQLRHHRHVNHFAELFRKTMEGG